MPDREQVRAILEKALDAKRATRRALASLPYEEKIRRMLQLQANLQAFRKAPVVHEDH